MIIRGSILNPRDDGSVQYLPHGVIVGDGFGRIAFVGDEDQFHALRIDPSQPVKISKGVILPAFLDLHTHIPQHPIRGRFAEGIIGDPPEGRLLAGLNRNVFPVEAKFESPDYARETVQAFLRDALSQGVLGGSAFLTVHPAAAEAVMEELPETWHAGICLMDQNCPEYLRNAPATIDHHLRTLAERFGRRFVITDRFAVACSSVLRRIGAAVARDWELRTQTHLNEQVREKEFVEKHLYPGRGYTDVYRQDRLLKPGAILAHCIHMRDDEWAMLQDAGCVVAHCPTSNLLLGSGVMNLETVLDHQIEYAICTDVGASPTCSMLYEMEQFLLVHDGRHPHGTAQEALYRATLAPARILGLSRDLGSFAPGKEMTFIEAALEGNPDQMDADAAIRAILNPPANSRMAQIIDQIASGAPLQPDLLDEITNHARARASECEKTILRVTVAGEAAYTRGE